MTGRVVDGDNKGVSGVVVALTKAGFSDTTDAQGAYQVEGELDSSIAKGGVLDTLVFKQQEREVATLPVTKWVANLPDIRIVQRDISGKLLPGSTSIARVEAVISGEGIPADKPVVIDLFHFALSNSYTGFAYFRGTASVVDYAVFVRVVDAKGRMTGRSPLVAFKSNAGNIPIPDFDPGNALPHAFVGNDTLLRIQDTLHLRADATDAFGGNIVKREWDIGGTGGFIETAHDDTLILLSRLRLTKNHYPDDGNITVQERRDLGYDWDSTLSVLPQIRVTKHLCVLRITDNEGFAVKDSVFVRIANGNPVLQKTAETPGMRDTVISGGDSLTFSIFAFSPGGIRRYLWDMDGDGIFEDTSSTGHHGHKYPFVPGHVHSIVRVEDNFDAFIMDTAIVSVLSLGKTWSTKDSAGPSDLYAVSWANGQLVAVGANGTICTSPNGEIWTSHSSGTTNPLRAIAWTGSRFVAVGNAGTIRTSPNGTAWTTRTSGTSYNLTSVAWTGELLLAPDTGFANIRVSVDDIAWSPRNIGLQGSQPLGGILGTGKLLVVVGEGKIITSPDGISWTTRDAGTSARFNSVAWTGSRLVAVGSNGIVSTSPDGVIWTSKNSRTTNSLRGVTWTGQQLIAVGEQGHVAISLDQGNTWAHMRLGSPSLHAVAWTGGRLVAVGGLGWIVVSP